MFYASNICHFITTIKHSFGFFIAIHIAPSKDSDQTADVQAKSESLQGVNVNCRKCCAPTHLSCCL